MEKEQIVFGNELQTGRMWDSLRRSLAKKICFYCFELYFEGTSFISSKKPYLSMSDSLEKSAYLTFVVDFGKEL